MSKELPNKNSASAYETIQTFPFETGLVQGKS
jgi:hypothetical protein